MVFDKAVILFENIAMAGSFRRRSHIFVKIRSILVNDRVNIFKYAFNLSLWSREHKGEERRWVMRWFTSFWSQSSGFFAFLILRYAIIWSKRLICQIWLLSLRYEMIYYCWCSIRKHEAFCWRLDLPDLFWCFPVAINYRDAIKPWVNSVFGKRVVTFTHPQVQN